MQQLSSRLARVLTASITVVTAIGAAAQTPPSATATPTANAENTTILVSERRTEAEAAHRDLLRLYIKEDLYNVFTDAGQYTVITFSPEQPQIKRAVLTHNLDVSDLAEPLKPESLHKIAAVIGARNILVFHAVQDKLGIRNSVTFEEIAAQNTWRTTLTNDFHTEAAIGKRKLKLEELAAVSVDAIARSLNIKCHLLQDLHLELALNPIAATASTTKPNGHTKAAVAPETQPPTSDSAGAQTTATSATTVAGSDAGTTTTTSAAGTTGGTTVPAPNPTPVPKTNGRRNKNSQTNPAIDPYAIQKDLVPTTGDGVQAVASQAEAGVIETISNERRAARYRESGDLASSILYLRRAVDDKPDDIEIRRKLVQAYEDDGAHDLAAAEIGRSLRLDAKNAPLYRLYGDSLFAAGKLPEATSTYQKAIELDPTDVQARIALGDILITSGDTDAAIKSYQEAATRAPSSPLPHRRLARAACQRAAADPSQYTVAVAEIKKGRTLAAPTETQGYLVEYVVLMKIMQSRLVDICDQLDNTYNAVGKSSSVQTNRLIADMMERATAGADFIDAVPAAVGQEGTQALFSEGAACILSSLSYLKSFVNQPDPQIELKLRAERTSARHDLTAAAQKIAAIKLITR